jgi:threonine dehydratase
LGLKTKIVGVVSELAPAYALSFEQGKCVEAQVSTKLADGMACRRADQEPLGLMLENLDHIVRVSEAEIADAMRFMFTDTHTVTEGAGAAPLAAALKEAEKLSGKRVALVASGANVDHEVFARILQGAMQ